VSLTPANENGAPGARLEGLDLARFLALVGMVFVNFRLVMGAQGQGALEAFASALEGRAAALFVVLAGVGLGLMAKRKPWRDSALTIFKRAIFLLIVGLLNTTFFTADILHYYAVYFLIAIFLLRASNGVLLLVMAGLIADFAIMAFVFDYDAGWNWETFDYSGFWTMRGFITNLFFNGWHPVAPWLAFVVYGLILARLSLHKLRTQAWLLAASLALWLTATYASSVLVGWAQPLDRDLAYLLGTAPIPPGPFYMLAGMGVAGAVIALCLILAAPLRAIGILIFFTTPGRQTLTLYVAHIYIGMGALEMLGFIGNQSLERAAVASVLFCLAAVLFAWRWSRRFRRGPLEIVMRAVVGRPETLPIRA